MTSGLFWDASALVKAYFAESGTPNVKGALALDVRGFATDFVALEVVTTFGKKRREGTVGKPALNALVSEFYADYPSRFDAADVQVAIRRDALKLAEKHHQNTAGPLDLLHVAAARHAARLTHPGPLVFVSADQALLDVARVEGLETYNPETQPHGALRAALRLPAGRS